MSLAKSMSYLKMSSAIWRSPWATGRRGAGGIQRAVDLAAGDHRAGRGLALDHLFADVVAVQAQFDPVRGSRSKRMHAARHSRQVEGDLGARAQAGKRLARVRMPSRRCIVVAGMLLRRTGRSGSAERIRITCQLSPSEPDFLAADSGGSARPVSCGPAPRRCVGEARDDRRHQGADGREQVAWIQWRRVQRLLKAAGGVA
jgi:hypothetical protein